MSEDFLDDEQQIAQDQDRVELFDSAALELPMSELPDLQPVVKYGPDATIRTAIDAMKEKRVGCLLIVDEEKLVGVFSERDVLTKVAGGSVDLDATTVSELMTRNPETLRFEDEVVYALHQMTLGGYRHIPLLDDNGNPVAVVSMRDIVGYIVSLYPDQIMNLPAKPNQSITSTREGA